jgi:hypothetical protein
LKSTKFDLDGSGKLSTHEVEQLLRKGHDLGLGTLVPDESQISAMIAKLDKNADGEVDFDEFRRFFSTLNPKPPINFARLDPSISDPLETQNPAIKGSSEPPTSTSTMRSSCLV